MPITVNINKLSLVHTQSTGFSIATIPDFCKTPPNGIPLPYPNLAYAVDLAKGTTTVVADGGNMCANDGSEFSKSFGDEAGSMGGILSGTFAAEATWLTFSMDVKLEGKGACRLTDKMWHNHKNTVNLAGVVNPPLTADDLKARLLACPAAQAVYDKAKAANGGKDPTIAMEPSVIKSGGDTDSVAGKIRIDKVDENGKAYDPCTQIETLAFELGNLSHKADFQAAQDQINTATRDQYIRAYEKVEYDNIKATMKVTDACKAAWGCPKMKSDFESLMVAKDFDDYFKHYLRDDHKENYGKAWDDAHKP